MKLGVKKKKYSSYASDKKKKSYFKVIAITLGSAIIVGCVYQFGVLPYYQTKVRVDTIAEVTNSKGEFVKAYVLNKDIEKGTPIKSEDLIEITENSKLVPINFLKSKGNLKGLVTRIKLGANTVITDEMLVKVDEEITDPIKNQDYDWIKVHAFLKLNDYVDIHYKEKDGTDTIVASKKKILNLNGQIFAINIDEVERAYINNATVKAAFMGGEVYTSIYPDPENQKPAKVTYVVDSQIEEKIKSNPNIVKDAVKSIKDNNITNNNEINNNNQNSTEVKKPSFTGGN